MSTSKATFGSISTCTLRSEDLIPTFCDELRALRGSVPLELWRDAQRCMRNQQVMDDIGSEVVSDLIDELQNFAPPYGYFGANDGDGADFGFWLSSDWERDAKDSGALFVSDTSEVPAGYSGEVVQVSDHGNATLYFARKGKLTEVWSVV
jgi:hypothetical protein